ncbi:hypothetical protein V500_01382 [Pseudogymnoascus sp. VKM F-4518 (FW-2643)]|nr:hypothetical protein V500_01382 [Pseudogymnoascus sp. VKM F-4518 (FW-2643)]
MLREGRWALHKFRPSISSRQLTENLEGPDTAAGQSPKYLVATASSSAFRGLTVGGHPLSPDRVEEYEKFRSPGFLGRYNSAEMEL